VTAPALDLLRELLAQSLAAWHLPGEVRRAGSGAVLLRCNGKEIRVEPAPPGSPFRWMVKVNGNSRGALSLPAVLRRVRAALDPAYERYQVRIAPAPVIPP
jgi:hypothetical protein